MPSINYSVSIIIPNFNGQALLSKNLSTVIQAAPQAEIIVVDDASTDQSVAYVRQNFPKVKVIVHPHNRRFAATVNDGVQAATGEIVILLNTDVEPTPSFLAPLLDPFSDPAVFTVGCAEINPEQDAQRVSGRAGGAFRRGLVVHWRMADQTQISTLWTSGGSSAYRKSIWEKLGGMDPLFAPAYEEDRDICYRALKRGYRVLFSPQSVVHHHHETTNVSVFGKRRINQASFKNHLLFVWKNITSNSLIVAHFLWLPYHLMISSVKTKGDFLIGFCWALSKLPQVIAKRRQEIQEGTVADETILAHYSH